MDRPLLCGKTKSVSQWISKFKTSLVNYSFGKIDIKDIFIRSENHCSLPFKQMASF